MIKLTKAAADKLAETLTIEDTLHPRDIDGGATCYDVKHAPIINEDGRVTGYHSNLWIVAALGPYDAEFHIL
tara:strand:- start:64 stop:279 length:216 start_codon:yes stop_codon:yes gene_type:complete